MMVDEFENSIGINYAGNVKSVVDSKFCVAWH